MKQNLYFFKHNNFKNRLYKPRPNPYSATFALNNANFNTNDGVDTSVTINYNSDTFDFDYIMEGYEVKNGQITTVNYRGWYITEAVRKSGNQIVLTLKRDIISDYFDSFKDKNFLIHRGICRDEDSAIYNSEGFQFNQVKTEETLLKDWSNTPWIIGFIPLGITLNESTFSTPEINDAISISGIENLSYYNSDRQIYIKTKNYDVFARIKFDVKTRNNLINLKPFANKKYILDDFATSQGVYADYRWSEFEDSSTIGKNYENIAAYLSTGVGTYESIDWNTYIFNAFKGTDNHSLFEYNDIMMENGKLYYDTSTQKYWRVKIESTSNVKKFSGRLKGNQLSTDVRTYLSDKTRGRIQFKDYDISKDYGSASAEFQVFIYTLTEEFAQAQYKINPQDFTNDTIKVKNQPYKMFAFPYLPEECSIFQNWTLMKNDMNVVNAFLSWWSRDSGRLIDLQLVPYFPEQMRISVYDDTKCIDVDSMDKFEIKDNDNVVKAIGVWIKDDSFSFDIANSYNVQDLKVENETQTFRICSPHYESIFEFNAAKLGGWDGIKAECTYKPYAPYIHLCPRYANGSLYGPTQFNDARGLVSSCNYSLPQASDEWTTFQRTNSTYQLTFNREVESMELTNDLQRVKEALGIVGGTVAAGIEGFAKGDVKGGVLGTTTALGGGIINSMLNERKRADTLGAKHDMFNYNIANIKAQPQTLTKVSALDINNRLFPILERYTCTSDERLYFTNYLYYNSYSIGRVGKLVDYISESQDYTFIQADILRLEVDGMGTHELNYLDELLKEGWYFSTI